MLERLKDKVAEIRSQAVTALQGLQDPRDEKCPIIRAYLFHLAHDPNNVVRRTIVRCIGATRLTLPHILERTRDTDEHVRRAAYKFLAEKVHIKWRCSAILVRGSHCKAFMEGPSIMTVF